LKPKVSIILPTFNRAQTLKRSIDSVYAQTFSDFELIIVDDGSTDETNDILELYRADQRFRTCFQPRGGCASARNLGLSLARAPYIAFQDSDDEWLPEKLEKSIALLERAGPEVGVIYSDMLYVLPDLTTVYYSSPEIERGRLIDEKRLDYQVAGVGIVSALIKRECFDRAGTFDDLMRRYCDLDLFIRISDHFDFVHCHEPLMKYYANEGMSTDREGLVIARERLIMKYRDRLKKCTHHLYSQELHLKIAMHELQIAQLMSDLSIARTTLENITSARSWRLMQQYARVRNSLWSPAKSESNQRH
jgi:glycosyltransferase involved in cell wall biosynthesis